MTDAVGIHIKGRAVYKGQPLFEDVDIDIGAGAWTGLLGSSGVGKSTLLRLLAGLDTHVTFEGTVQASTNVQLSKIVSYMAQSDLLLPWAQIEDNITLGCRLRGESNDAARKAAIIEELGLADHIHKYPAELSGGQRQRVALARTLMEDTPVVLLDEPFSALDVKTKFQMQELVSRMLKGKTVLLVSHDPAEAARLCQKIYVLSADHAMVMPSLNPPFPKDFRDPAVFKLQNKLLMHIRGDM